MKKKWQGEWDGGNKGRYYYSIQRKLGEAIEIERTLCQE